MADKGRTVARAWGGGAETHIHLDDGDGTWAWTSVCTAGATGFLGFIYGAGLASSRRNRQCTKTKLPWKPSVHHTCTAALCSAAQRLQSCLLNLCVWMCLEASADRIHRTHLSAQATTLLIFKISNPYKAMHSCA